MSVTSISESAQASMMADIKATLEESDATITATCHLIRGALLVTLIAHPGYLDELGEQGFADHVTALLPQEASPQSRHLKRRA